MRIISKKRILEFINEYSDSESSLLAWHDIVKAADWNNPLDLTKTFNSVDMVDGQVVFNIAQNRYRLIAEVNFTGKRVYIRNILTHKQYDKGNWKP